MNAKLKIKTVAERTGVAAATIRVWEQRYGFPNPARTPAGYRLYTQRDVDDIRAVMALRRRGLSVPDAIERARFQTAAAGAAFHPSIYAAVAASDPSARPRILHRASLTAISHAIEDELLSRGARGLVFGAFQHAALYEQASHRYDQIAMRSDATVVFADFASVSSRAGAPTRVPIAPSDALGNEWAVVIDAPGFAVCLLAWERPDRGAAGEPVFEAMLSLDPAAVRRASLIAAALARRQDDELGASLDALLGGRPVAPEPRVSSLTSLTSRIVAYLDEQTFDGPGRGLGADRPNPAQDAGPAVQSSVTSVGGASI